MLRFANRNASKKISKELTIDGFVVTYTVKKVKNINLRVKQDGSGVAVSAPPWVSEQQVMSFVQSRSAWIKKQQEKTEQALLSQAHQATPEELASYKAYVMSETPPLIEKWETIMGVKAQTLAYRNMTSRWGSCNPKTGRICVNIQLARYPYECLEYLVVHELCHLLERGHGPRFKQLMTQFLPDWQERRAQLRSTDFSQ